MMSRSPRRSDRAQRASFSVCPANLCVPMTGARSANPLPKTRREHVTFHGWSKSMGFLSPREKTQFSKTG